MLLNKVFETHLSLIEPSEAAFLASCALFPSLSETWYFLVTKRRSRPLQQRHSLVRFLFSALLTCCIKVEGSKAQVDILRNPYNGTRGQSEFEFKTLKAGRHQISALKRNEGLKAFPIASSKLTERDYYRLLKLRPPSSNEI